MPESSVGDSERRALTNVVAESMAGWHAPTVERAVFATDDPDDVAGHLDRYCSEHLGAEVADGLLYGASAGCTAGVRLADGRAVVVKAYQPTWTHDFLVDVVRTQRHLHLTGFPCPRPLAGPLPCGPALATAEELVPDPGMRVLATSAEMCASATALADLVARCAGFDATALASHPMRSDDRPGLYPPPHNPIFDFSADETAAAWIDELAAAAKAARDAAPSAPVVGHSDWSARNVRISAAGLVTAYDWDSLTLVSEEVVVGQAAATWRSTGEAADPIAPDRDEVLAYLAAYEAAAGRRLDRRAVLGGALWALAYTARCEHALEAVTGARVARGRGRLAADGANFLRS